MRKLIFLLAVLLWAASGYSQNHKFSKKNKNLKIKPVIGLQLWSTYTMGTEVFDEKAGVYKPVENRLNTHIRRTRLGVKGEVYTNLKFNITTSIDLVGRDVLAGTQGGANNGSSPKLALWNAYLQWKIKQKGENLNLTIGYLPPQIGRESITPALRVTSMEKSWSQNYLRRQLVGTGPGRALGFNLGGLFWQEGHSWGFSYDLGLFNPVFHSWNGNSVGSKFAPLWVGRAVIFLGEPESKKYTMSHRVNYFGERKGFSLAMSGARQGSTELFKSHYVLGVDWLFNWKNLNFDGEWSFLNKTKEVEAEEGENTEALELVSNTGYARLSYNLPLPNGHILEPVLMMTQFNGAMGIAKQELAKSLEAFAGKDYAYYMGLNYYWNPDLKLSLGYTWRQADLGEMTEGATFNNYFYQSGVGAIHRGDWLGLGLTIIL